MTRNRGIYRYGRRHRRRLRCDEGGYVGMKFVRDEVKIVCWHCMSEVE
jgi:hypothetical protein